MTNECAQALRTVFERFSFRFGWTEETLGGRIDRSGQRVQVFAVDGTRQMARQRCLPEAFDLPPATRRMPPPCAVEYPGRTRSEVVRSLLSRLFERHVCSVGEAFSRLWKEGKRGRLLSASA